MPRQFAPPALIAAAFVSALAGCSDQSASDSVAAATSASAVPPVIKQRQDNFEAIGDAFKALRSELEEDAPDYAQIAARAGDINARAARISDHFPAGTSVDDGHDTEALPAIWKKPEEFKAAAAKLSEESARLANLAPAGDKAAVAAQAKAMGGACKGCHEQFRLDDEKN